MKEHPETPGSAMLRSTHSQGGSPVMNDQELRQVEQLLNALPSLSYPINSAAELVEQLGGSRATVEIFNIPISPSRLARGIPAHYFPIASDQNLSEKLAELLRRDRKQVMLLKELGRIRHELPAIRFPIKGANELLQAFDSVDSIAVKSPRVPARHPLRITRDRIRRWITENMKAEAFPIQSEEELYFKALRIVPRSAH